MADQSSLVSILYTGGSGAMGASIGSRGTALTFRLEATVEAMAGEISARRAAGPTCLIHLAAMTSVDGCEREPERCLQVNRDGALKAYAAAARCQLERFVFVSTAHVYRVAADPIDVTAPVEPRGSYARSKLAAERGLEGQQQAGTALSIARVFSVTGATLRPGFLYSSLVERAQRRDYAPLRGFDNVRDFLPVERVADELVRLAQSRSFPPLVNICSGVGTRVGDLARQVYEQYAADASQLVGAPGRPDDARTVVGVPSDYD